jgi:HEAT repeat protein
VTEQRRSQLTDLLGDLRRLGVVPDCTVLLPLVRHKWWQVRWDAIGALAKCRSDPRAETALLDVLAHTDDDYDRINANAALSECGTTRAIPALAAQVHHAKDDVKCSAINALGEVGDASVLPILLDALADRSAAAKWHAMLAIDRHGDERAIEPVCDRMRVILARRRQRLQGPRSELLAALQFLARYPADPRSRATLGWVAGKRLAYLTEDEAQWVTGQLAH